MAIARTLGVFRVLPQDANAGRGSEQRAGVVGWLGTDRSTH
jgi:hypothetical protein